MKIHCKYDDLMAISELKKRFHPDNPNTHDTPDIQDLAKVLEYNGIREAARLSSLTDRLTTSHGRILAAEILGMETYPVVFHEYDDEAMEYADLIADNAMAKRSVLDMQKINRDFVKFGPELDLKLMGLKDFKVDMSENQNQEKKEKEKKIQTCPECGHQYCAQ